MVLFGSSPTKAIIDFANMDRFKELARPLECDDDQAAFDEKLKKPAKAPVSAKVVKPEKA